MNRKLLLSNLPERYKWSERVQNAASFGRFALADKIRASSWKTSVTIEIAPYLRKRDGSDMPKDLHMQDLANQFDKAVDDDDIDTAAILLMAISNREHELFLEEMFPD